MHSGQGGRRHEYVSRNERQDEYYYAIFNVLDSPLQSKDIILPMPVYYPYARCMALQSPLWKA
ncbi:wiskott-Aldrich syndrome protein family member 2 [Platysternon megacephalum]|uniref:Wiskott-Aldrich syndrome protein family member 2 n=1 Tax=Platysternon megacephalum TaxID=55544 RepID=A0A4D9ERY2_9SAUR|nr:wiskott-Aldrich syndrome protein family member 2 [Platysternon megacephalum]